MLSILANIPHPPAEPIKPNLYSLIINVACQIIWLSSRIWDLNYSINYSYSKFRREQSADQILSVNLQIPFKRWLKRTWGYGIQNSFDHCLIQQVNINHSPFADNRLFLALQQNYQQHYKNHTNHISGGLYSEYQNQYAIFNLGYNHDPYQNQLNYGLQVIPMD